MRFTLFQTEEDTEWPGYSIDGWVLMAGADSKMAEGVLHVDICIFQHLLCPPVSWSAVPTVPSNMLYLGHTIDKAANV